ncbi:MAG TPA: hypothetical protein VKM36_02190 [Balneolaceae bacterium]|nr:hypothetical protein [Balneolaceae bacterium]
MKKALKFILIPVAALILIAIILTFTIDSIVRSTIESRGSEILQTELSINNVNISLFGGTGSIEGLTIANPDEFEGGEALTISSIQMSLDLSTILSDTVVVNQLTIREMDVNYRLKATGSNLGKLLDNLESYSADTEDDAESSMIIELFVMEESTVSIDTQFEELQTISVTLPYIEREGIGRGGDQSVSQVVKSVLEIIITRVSDIAFDAVKDEGAEKILDRAGDAIKDLFNN